jgi:hypothetical protein
MAIDQTIHDALQRLTASLQQEFDAKLRATAAELAQSVEQERQVAETESASGFAAQLAAAQEEANRRVADEAARVRAEAEQRFAEEVGRLRGELDTLARERAELQRAATDLDDARRRVTTAEQALEELRHSSASAKADADRMLAELADLRSRAAGDQEELEKLRGAATDAARVEERQDKLATLDRLLGSVRRVDTVTSLTEVLNVLAEAVAAEAPRSAVLVAAPDGFRPYRVSGFKEITPRAVAREEVSSLERGLPFDPLPPDHVGFAVPIEVGSQTVALVYADDFTGEEQAVPASWPEAVEVLARYAALRLSMLTALKTVQAMKAGQVQAGSSAVSTMGRATAPSASMSTTEDDQSARRYARPLVSEIKLYNEATVRIGRMHRDLFDRLRPEIERARKLYEQRVPAHVPARSTYFDDELVHTLADGDPALLGGRR